ncbi:hypothetical protein ACSC9U_00070 [Pseudomonas solani]|uniref:hypothetical protein n=1 Tax=Pseudomonas solani TaxID=2731552 RepID=UPI003F4AB468
MLKAQALPLALASLGLPFMAMAAAPQGELERHISYMKGETGEVVPIKPRAKLFGRQALALTNASSGTLTVGKIITYDAVNYSPYNEEPTDTSSFNMVMMGYSPAGPAMGAVSAGLSGITSLALAKMTKGFNNPPIPEMDEVCNLMLTSTEDFQGLNIGGIYLPLTKTWTSVKNGTTYYDYAAVVWDGAPTLQYYIDQHAFCTTFESFNSTYPNGSTVALTLVP